MASHLLENISTRQEQIADPGVLLSTSSRTWVTVTFVSLSAVFIYLQVFMLPATPRLATGDQAIYLHHAVRMLDGQLIYRDYDHFTFPGTDVLYMALFRLFGVRAWIPQGMLIVVGASMVWLILFISRRVLPGTWAYLPAGVFVVLPFSSYLDATHHWFGLVAATSGLAVLLEKRSWTRLLWAGVLSGFATFFTQSMALITVGFAVFLVWEQYRENQTWTSLAWKEVALLSGFLTTITASMAYFVWKVGFKTIFYYTVVFVVKYYPADWFNNWHVYLSGRPGLHAWTTWFDLPAFVLIHLIVPYVYVVYFAVRASQQEQPRELRYRLLLINVTGLFLFLTVASAPAYTRLYVVSPPALVLLVWLISGVSKHRRLFSRLAWVSVLLMLIARPLMMQLRWKAYLQLPTGQTALLDPLHYEKFSWMLPRVKPGEYLFGDHLLSFTLRLRNSGRVPFLRPTEYTRPEEVADAVEGLEKFHVRYVSWYIGLDREKDAGLHPEGNHLAPLRQYLYQHYHVAKTFANGDQIWERND
jgi:hypothetical protein